MSLPEFVDCALPKSMQLECEGFFAETDRYRIFGERIYPLLVQARAILEKAAYCLENGCPGVEPLWLLGVSLLQYCERIPDRQAVEMLRYHVGWNFAMHRCVGQAVFHPTSLVYFRRRLLDHQQSRLLLDQILEGLMEAKLVKRKASQRLDSTRMWGLLSQMGRLECVRESLRLALEELAGQGLKEHPGFWSELWPVEGSNRLKGR